MHMREFSIETPAMRRVKDQDEQSGVPMCIYWDTAQVADWMVDIGYPQYRECIERNFVSGMQLIELNASILPNMGINDFEHIKDIAAKVRQLIGLKSIIRDVNVSMKDPMIAYMVTKRRTGRQTANTSFQQFVIRHRRWFP